MQKWKYMIVAPTVEGDGWLDVTLPATPGRIPRAAANVGGVLLALNEDGWECISLPLPPLEDGWELFAFKRQAM